MTDHGVSAIKQESDDFTKVSFFFSLFFYYFCNINKILYFTLQSLILFCVKDTREYATYPDTQARYTNTNEKVKTLMIELEVI